MDFQHAIIKDLIWLIKSPGLLKPENKFIPDQLWYDRQLLSIHDGLLKLDNNPELLKKFENNISPFVGDYFEKLTALWLEKNPDIQQIRQHITVFENKRTIGEFDFLFFDSSTQTSYHWEVAIKYYLQYFNGQEYEFLGPNAKDSLTKKTTKMLDHQLLLSINPHAGNLLADYPKPIRPTGILKGMLFYPASGNWLNPDNLPPGLNKHHLKGWWSHADSLDIPQKSATSHWFILKKPFWLTIHPDKTQPPYNPYNINSLKSAIQLHFEKSDRPLLLAEVMQKKTGMWEEVSRGFIVPTHWPQLK